MENITLAVDELLTAVRRYTERRRISVDTLIREYLAIVARREDRAAAARKRIRELSVSSEARRGRGSRIRDDLYSTEASPAGDPIPASRE